MIDKIISLAQYLDNTKVLIFNKQFYLEYKEDIDNLLKQNFYMVDIIVTDTLEDNYQCLIIDKENFNKFFNEYYEGSDK